MSKSLHLAEWPEADRCAWEAAQCRGGLFDERGAASGWSERTCSAVVYSYGLWLRFLVETAPDVLSLPPADRIVQIRIAGYLAQLRQSCGFYALTAYTGRLLAMARIVGPERDWAWLAAIKRGFERACTPRAFPLVHPNRVIDLGEALVAGGLASESALARRSLIRDGTILVLATLIPLRRRNLAALDLEAHLLDVGEAWRIEIPAEETKTGQALSFVTSERLTGLLDRYLAEARPLFPNQRQTSRLWLSNKGGALGDQALYDVIVERTAKGLRQRLTPHALRHLAATVIAEQHPDKALLARDLLGHVDYRMTERHYISARSLAAGKRFADALKADQAAPQIRRHLRRSPERTPA